MINRPELSQFSVELSYPRYVGRKNEQLQNMGNLEVPEGTVVNWRIKALHADQVSMRFGRDSAAVNSQKVDGQLFTYKRTLVDPDWYEVKMRNANSENKERIHYTVRVIKDQHPEITVNNLKDTV